MTKRGFYEMFPTPAGPHGWIQWKGTDVCMDVHCACGALTHVDADFVYHVRCSKCGRLYACDGNIRLVELTEEEARDAECVEDTT